MAGAPAEIVSFLERGGIPFKQDGEGRWAVQLRGERKLTIPVTITVGDAEVRFETFFMRKPLENVDRFYEVLLRRNMLARGVAFALDGTGDVYIVGALPVSAIDDDRLDRMFGAILIEADGLFDAAIEIGFASYLAADMAWRARASEQQ